MLLEISFVKATMALLYFLMCALLVSGCSAPRNLTYNSDPSGAMLYLDGKFVGYTPVTVAYRGKSSGACFRSPSFMVRWASGAEYTADYGAWCAGDFRTTAVRPDAPGVEIDEQVAARQNEILMEIQQEVALKSNAPSKPNLSWIIDALAILQQTQRQQPPQQQPQQPPQQQPQRSGPVRCISRAIGSTVFTDCN
jgi:hypothetical protein